MLTHCAQAGQRGSPQKVYAFQWDVGTACRRRGDADESGFPHFGISRRFATL